MIKKNMKMVMLVYNHALDDEMFDVLKESGITHYTKVEGVTGSGDSGPHMGTNIWPAINNMLFIAVDPGQLKTLHAAGKELAEKFPGEGMRGFMFTLAEMW